MRRLFFCLSLGFAACSGENAPSPVPETCTANPAPGAVKTVSIWVQDDPDLDVKQAVDGLDLWKGKCIKGETATSELQADAKIYGSHDDCVRNDKSGGYILAVSVPGGKIVVYLECMRQLFSLDSDGHISRLMLKLVLAHELGHESGMWFHVPATCDDTAAKGDFEKSLVMMGVCGKALMNAFIDPSVQHVTKFDVEAYDLRDANSSTFPRVEEMPDGCVLTYWPPS